MTKKFWKRIVIGIVSVLGILSLGAYIYLKSTNEDLPKGKEGPEADALATLMMEALQVDAWNQTNFVEWTFRGAHDYMWCKNENICYVRWDENEVRLDISDRTKSTSLLPNGEKGYDEALTEKAWNYFCNDSFWLIAPFKVFDEGVKRYKVGGDTQLSLLVTYTDGGVTPGDSYLWHLNEDGTPKSYQMWTSILPMKGIEVTWENWITTESGVKIATMHDLGMAELEMTNVVGRIDGCE